ncbi:MAG: SIS domain-containing protein [Deltaproteobacteria bacterium]|nr:SIS domain-containing protein [Deltaproteobacteria bacterium]
MYRQLIDIIRTHSGRLTALLLMPVFFGKEPSHVCESGIVFFPYMYRLSCGLTGFIAFTDPVDSLPARPDIEEIESLCDELEIAGISSSTAPAKPDLSINNVHKDRCSRLMGTITACKSRSLFYSIFADAGLQDRVKRIADRLGLIIEKAEARIADDAGRLSPTEIKKLSGRIETAKDAKWGLESELLKNMAKINGLLDKETAFDEKTVFILRQVNSVLNSIDRIEVRGRDSAGISLFFHLDQDVGAHFSSMLEKHLSSAELDARLNKTLLLNRGISITNHLIDKNRHITSVALVYKTANEIGRLGENIENIREQIRSDPAFQAIITLPCIHFSTIAHTRWASVGEISEANCHPVDNLTPSSSDTAGIIHVCLNGDIDNFQSLKAAHEETGIHFDDSITCDTKIIPVHIQSYLNQNFDIIESFRRAVNDFEGSHAISMQTDLAPGKIFLALKGSGQSIFIGTGPNGYMPASEVYGFVEEAQSFIKMEGQCPKTGKNNEYQGQICILEPADKPGMNGITAMSYDGSKIHISDNDIKKTLITTRDIDRHEFPHFFLKEISESPESVKKTIEGRWRVVNQENPQYEIALDAATVPRRLESAFKNEKIKRIFFIGQGTAGIAAAACANIMLYYLDNPCLDIRAMKSSELSGMVTEKDSSRSMEDTLIVPISQSGTTTDTNKTVEIMKELGAWSIAIVNRRDSELTFKTDGVLYTSSGRDIEMSVASTKAFYSQIIAGTILGLYFAGISGRRPIGFISNEIVELLKIPSCMKRVLAMSDKIAASANRLALKREHWATVGSGPNRAAADEIRIKLSELCYKTISSDYVEDKKHIDLSSEPLIIVCAAGTRQNVLGDIVKDTAIFQSHKAITLVIADENDDRFEPYADDIFYVPHLPEHFAPLINTLAGHLWGYFAALAINKGSIFLDGFRRQLSETIEGFAAKELDIYEIALEKGFREKIARFYTIFRRQQSANKLPSIIGIKSVTDLILLLKYLSGRLPVADFELDFGVRGTAKNMIAELFTTLSNAINTMARPVDAIKHQAKTVTVGTSRIEEKIEGLIFNTIKTSGFSTDRLTMANVLVIRNIQRIISSINGLTLYRVSGINLLGEPTDTATIKVMKKEGSSAAIASRSETEQALKGTKRIIVREGNVYIGKGRKDKRSILVIPIMRDDPERPNTIEYLILLEISFKKDLPIQDRVKALGGKHERIKNLVQESNIIWKNEFLDLVATEDLFGVSAEKIAEIILSMATEEGKPALAE